MTVGTNHRRRSNALYNGWIHFMIFKNVIIFNLEDLSFFNRIFFPLFLRQWTYRELLCLLHGYVSGQQFGFPSLPPHRTPIIPLFSALSHRTPFHGPFTDLVSPLTWRWVLSSCLGFWSLCSFLYSHLYRRSDGFIFLTVLDCTEPLSTQCHVHSPRSGLNSQHPLYIP